MSVRWRSREAAIKVNDADRKAGHRLDIAHSQAAADEVSNQYEALLDKIYEAAHPKDILDALAACEEVQALIEAARDGQ